MEIDIWADLFRNVEIAAPVRNTPPPGDALAFSRPNISLLPQRETGGRSVFAKAHQVMMLPLLLSGLARAMQGADAVHVRCPGNLGLLGVVVAPLFSPYRVTKYAGQWSGYPGEPWTVRAQRALLRSRWWGAPVTVYGECPDQPRHVVPFFTSVMTREQLHGAKQAAACRESPVGEIRVLYVGRLTRGKNVHVLLEALQRSRRAGCNISCTIVGDGPEREALEAQALGDHLAGCVAFLGALPFEEVLQIYPRADVLVLVSETEGWPKALVEAMAFGLVCIGSDRGLVPQVLADNRGIIVRPGDAGALSAALIDIASDPVSCSVMRNRATEWAAHYSLEGLRDALHQLLTERWGFRPGRVEPPIATPGRHGS